MAQVSINNTQYIISQAFGSAQTITNMMSVKNAKDAIQGIVLALTGSKDFDSPLANLDSAGLADLDQRVKKMEEAWKKLGGRGV